MLALCLKCRIIVKGTVLRQANKEPRLKSGVLFLQNIFRNQCKSTFCFLRLWMTCTSQLHKQSITLFCYDMQLCSSQAEVCHTIIHLQLYARVQKTSGLSKVVNIEAWLQVILIQYFYFVVAALLTPPHIPICPEVWRLPLSHGSRCVTWKQKFTFQNLKLSTTSMCD